MTKKPKGTEKLKGAKKFEEVKEGVETKEEAVTEPKGAKKSEDEEGLLKNESHFDFKKVGHFLLFWLTSAGILFLGAYALRLKLNTFSYVGLVVSSFFLTPPIVLSALQLIISFQSKRKYWLDLRSVSGEETDFGFSIKLIDLFKNTLILLSLFFVGFVTFFSSGFQDVLNNKEITIQGTVKTDSKEYPYMDKGIVFVTFLDEEDNCISLNGTNPKEIHRAIPVQNGFFELTTKVSKKVEGAKLEYMEEGYKVVGGKAPNESIFGGTIYRDINIEKLGSVSAVLFNLNELSDSTFLIEKSTPYTFFIGKDTIKLNNGSFSYFSEK